MSRIVNLFIVFGIILTLSCKKNDEKPIPTPFTITMNATESALIGQWSWDKTETYNSTNGTLASIQYANGTCETYNNGNLISTDNASATYYYYKFLTTSYDQDGITIEQRWFDLKINANGNSTDGAWVVKINYNESGKDYIQVPFSAYIFSLTPSELVTRNNTNSELLGTIIKYYHKL
jgi:hypothetical protein